MYVLRSTSWKRCLHPQQFVPSPIENIWTTDDDGGLLSIDWIGMPVPNPVLDIYCPVAAPALANYQTVNSLGMVLNAVVCVNYRRAAIRKNKLICWSGSWFRRIDDDCWKSNNIIKVKSKTNCMSKTRSPHTIDNIMQLNNEQERQLLTLSKFNDTKWNENWKLIVMGLQLLMNLCQLLEYVSMNYNIVNEHCIIRENIRWG